MPPSREQLILRAQDMVRKTLAMLGNTRLVPEFVDAYAVKYERAGLKSSPLRYRELITTITRESLVAITAKVNSDLPRRLTGRKAAVLRARDAQAAEVFREEYYLALAKALKWTPGELEEFYGDAELYAQMALRAGGTSPPRSGARAGTADSPFLDRCALLLDPSLLEKARLEAAKLLGDLERSTEKILASVFKRSS